MKKGVLIVSISVLLTFGLSARNASSAQTICTPYQPDGGLFITQNIPFTPLNMNPSAQPVQAGLYSISMNSARQVVVIQGNTTAPDALVQIPAGDVAYYLFWGYNNRFLILDFHTDPSSTPSTFTYQQVVVDLTAGTGTTPQLGHFLPSVSKPSNFQLHVYPGPYYTTNSSDTGNGLAFFVWYGLSNEVDNAGVYRSDTGEQICFDSLYTANVQAEAKITPTTVQILDGGQVKRECPLPRGSLHIESPATPFGTIPADQTVSSNYTFRNIGNDCMSISSVSPSVHFRPNPSPPFTAFALPAGGSQAVGIQFNPAGQFGSFTETLAIGRNPASGDSSLTATGVSIPPAHLTVLNQILPSNDPGLFNFEVDTSPPTNVTNVGNNGGTGSLGVNPGTFHITETSALGTNLADYETTIDCGSGPSAGSSLAVTLMDGDDKKCTVTNRGKPRLHLLKVLRPAIDSGRFDLLVDNATKASAVGNGGGSGPLIETVGTHTITEVAANGTNAANYATTVDCGAGPVPGASGTVSLSQGDDKTCKFTNLGPPELVLEKYWIPRPRTLVDIKVDGIPRTFGPIGSEGASSTGPMLLSPGQHNVSEVALQSYKHVFLGDCDFAGNVSLAQGSEKTCILVNTRKGVALPRCFAGCALKYKSCFSAKDLGPRQRAICDQDFESCLQSTRCGASPFTTPRGVDLNVNHADNQRTFAVKLTGAFTVRMSAFGGEADTAALRRRGSF